MVLETLCFIGSEYKRDKIHAEITEFLTIRARVTLQVRIGVQVPGVFIQYLVLASRHFLAFDSYFEFSAFSFGVILSFLHFRSDVPSYTHACACLYAGHVVTSCQQS